MKRLYSTSILVLLLGLYASLAGCQSATQHNTPATPMPASPALIGSETGTTMPPASGQPTTLTATKTPAYTPSATVPVSPSATPVLPDWVTQDFFFGRQTADCMLPCWQQLRIGESTGNDIQDVFGGEFGLGEFDFLKDTPDRRGYTNVGGMYGKEYNWAFNQDLTDDLSIAVWTEQGTTILEGLQFTWIFASRDELNLQMSPQRIIDLLHKYAIISG